MAAWGSMPKVTMFICEGDAVVPGDYDSRYELTRSWTWPCGCMKPPMFVYVAKRSLDFSHVSMAGMMVW